MLRREFQATDESVMVALGAGLAAASEPGLVIYLRGELGMGKTTFSRGFIQSLGHRGPVKSPTYTLVEPYTFEALEVFHFDLYRLGDPAELEFMGIRDYFGGDSICLIEWPERGIGVLPPADLEISIEPAGTGRLLQVRAGSVVGDRVAQRWQPGN
ncbi:tRNA (adenosine(37)-N6)-threonylcarbamoyltransferase complex ATPase subunit type 1 TsaE [Kineobactrum sediminis]|uniref:tRNA threonylcarbamoyladenosine biosynthesis protein TsaE n=1 Tax=Kineobactrum sediminis TaxID=1905677 RepID=A0A2N5Y0B0_9GAMM|nr:tRNA (adenosine(37)-N6)-threonylcarbamoyltransferase complex ATPase subunit type 1 TsaE [Kineobactrum sediminis]PLW81825.1 tRNA (adenosine(37)-N6)-threonylcarbamoyltransferase complex ATPase subunit type 1 TsaE [Kineobactrum sediminis]